MRSVNLKVKHERKYMVTLNATDIAEILAQFVERSPGWPEGVKAVIHGIDSQSGIPDIMFGAEVSEERDSAPQRVEIPKAAPNGPTVEDYQRQISSRIDGSTRIGE